MSMIPAPTFRRLLFTLAIATAVAVIIASLTWALARSEVLRQEREQTLQDVEELLADNARLVAELGQGEIATSEASILSRYLDSIRKDGVPKHSATKRKIDRLIDNNTTIVALIRRYVHRDGNATFRAAVSEYIDYTASLRDRWQAVFEIFMAGGNLPAANGERPASFERELKLELAGTLSLDVPR